MNFTRFLPWLLLLTLLGGWTGAAWAQDFPPLTGRVVDAADILQPQTEAELTAKLQQLEDTTRRQLVVATVPDLQDYPIEEYGYRLGREWAIGSGEDNDGIILLVAPNERKVRIEVGYGLEGIMSDGLSFLVINRQILPRFKAGDLEGGILAGVDTLATQLSVSPEEAAANLRAAEDARQSSAGQEGGQSWGLIWLLLIVGFNIWAMSRRGKGRRRRGGLVFFGMPTHHGGGSGGFSSGGFSGGGFSGGGGSFGGGGASGGW
ncbi:TPM domain-containing protein [Pacificimonas sp. ICDLI1SI03]